MSLLRRRAMMGNQKQSISYIQCHDGAYIDTEYTPNTKTTTFEFCAAFPEPKFYRIFPNGASIDKMENPGRQSYPGNLSLYLFGRNGASPVVPANVTAYLN